MQNRHARKNRYGTIQYQYSTFPPAININHDYLISDHPKIQADQVNQSIQSETIKPIRKNLKFGSCIEEGLLAPVKRLMGGWGGMAIFYLTDYYVKVATKRENIVKLPALKNGAFRKGKYLFQIASLNPALKGGACREANRSRVGNAVGNQLLIKAKRLANIG